MTSKVPTAEEVLALVTAASTSEPTMHQLLMHAQQAQMLAAVDMQHHHLGKTDGAVDATAAAMDLMTAHGVAMDGAVMPAVGDATSSATIRRKSIPLSMKKEAIEWIMGPGKGVPSRAEKHFSAKNWDVSASSFRKWWKNRDRIMNDSSTKKRITGGGRKPYLEDTEERLLVIVIQDRAKKDRVTRKWIAKTAQHMFQRTNANFKASENWVTKFIRRNGLTLKRSYVTYDHAGGVPRPDADGTGAEVPPGTIEVHDDDDDDDDEEVVVPVDQQGAAPVSADSSIIV